MKTYLLDSINRYKRFSEKLDVKTVLCNKSWWVFNDSGEKEIYIFQEDGSLIISLNGQVTDASWSFISANKSLIIKTSKQAVMVHSAFADGVILAFQVDGTNQYAFLIDESNRKSFSPKSLNDVNNYFLKKEEKIEAKKKKIESKIEEKQLKIKKKEQLAEKRQREYIYRKKLQTVAVIIRHSKLYRKWRKRGISWFNSGYFILSSVVFFLYCFFSIMSSDLYFPYDRIIPFTLPLVLFVLCAVLIKLWGKRHNKNSFELVFRKKNGDWVKYKGSKDDFDTWCLDEAFSTLTVSLESNVSENIASYMQGAGELKISYLHKHKIIGVDRYDLSEYD